MGKLMLQPQNQAKKTVNSIFEINIAVALYPYQAIYDSANDCHRRRCGRSSCQREQFSAPYTSYVNRACRGTSNLRDKTVQQSVRR